MAIDLDRYYQIAENLVTKEIEGELVIVPVKSGLGDLDGEMYALTTTGIAVWHKLDGKKPLKEIIDCISSAYSSPQKTIQKDIVELLEVFLEKGLIVEL